MEEFYPKQKVICITSDRYSKTGDRLRVIALGYSHILCSDGMLHEKRFFKDYKKIKERRTIPTGELPIWWTIG